VSASRTVGPREGYDLWAPSYGNAPNPLLALEHRLLFPRLPLLAAGKPVVDVGCGTGRWLGDLRKAGASILGVDPSRAMLQQAATRPELRRGLALGSLEALPVRTGTAGLTLCAFVLSYLPDLPGALSELARTTARGGRVIITDLHPEAQRAWKRAFDVGACSYEIRSHPFGLDDLLHAAQSAGLRLEDLVQAPFGEPERPIFQEAGREDSFEQLKSIPAVLIALWRRD
jgi:ubiquinone/menaquinone biosynthesis C-methylase UbiE